MTGNRVMIIDDQDSSREYLARIIQHENLDPVSCSTLADAGQALQEHPDDFLLVITRLKLADGDSLELMREIGSELPAPPPFIVIGSGSRPEIIQAFSHGARDFFTEPYNPRKISAALDRARQQALKEERKVTVYQHLREKSLAFVIANRLELVQPLVEVLTAEIGSSCRLSTRQLAGMGMGLHELLVNAIEHGNLEIPSRLKERPDYLQYLKRRAETMPYRERRVGLKVRITPEGFSCTVSDQGPGFDWRNLPRPGDPENLAKAHGRGIIMAGSFFDEFIFNEAGNEITVKKSFSRPGRPLADADSPGKTVTD